MQWFVWAWAQMKGCSAFHMPTSKQISRWARGRGLSSMRLLKLSFPLISKALLPPTQWHYLSSSVSCEWLSCCLSSHSSSWREACFFRSVLEIRIPLDYSQSLQVSRLNTACYSPQISRFSSWIPVKMVTRWEEGRKSMNREGVKERRKKGIGWKERSTGSR